MILHPKPTAATANEPVTLSHLRAQIKADDTYEDGLLLGYLIAAREMVEADIGQSLGSQTLVATSEGWPSNGDSLLIPVAVSAVTSITYTAVGGATTPWTDFVVRKTPAGNTLIRPETGTTWPVLGDDPVITVTVTGGLNPVPERARQAILLLAGHWAEHRESVVVGQAASEVPLAYKALVNGLGAVRVG